MIYMSYTNVSFVVIKLFDIVPILFVVFKNQKMTNERQKMVENNKTLVCP